MEVILNPNIYKNAFSVGIPHFDLVGINYAIILGALLKNPEKKLELFEDLTPQIVKQAKELIHQIPITIQVDTSKKNLFVHTKITTNNEYIETTIEDNHTNLTKILYNQEILYQQDAKFA